MLTEKTNRIQSIDLLRGLVIVIMALDHVRDYFHFDAFVFDPLDLSQTNVPLYFTRYITNFCAPVFCFLAGTSAFFVSRRRTKKEMSVWLFKRGALLVVLEFTVLKLGWYFWYDPSFFDMTVIWSLGMSMIFLAGLVHLPKTMALIIGAALVVLHNLTDGFQPAPTDLAGKLWYVLHISNEIKAGSTTLYTVYPLLPWFGLITLGYFFGGMYLPGVDAKKRIKQLLIAGVVLVILFFIFRIPNLYGDLRPWTKQKSFMYDVLAILNVHKYPPSFLFACITIGPALIFLAMAEKWSGAWARVFITFGRVPMFFYILHIYLIHALAVIAAVATGYDFNDMILETWIVLTPELKGYGFSLPVVYLVWIVAVCALYPASRWYSQYKASHPDKKWLSYI